MGRIGHIRLITSRLLAVRLINPIRSGLRGDYQARGYKPAKDWRRADEIIVNTCAVRERAEHRARGFIYNVVQYSQASKKPKPKIILTGCMTHHGEKKLFGNDSGIGRGTADQRSRI